MGITHGYKLKKHLASRPNVRSTASHSIAEDLSVYMTQGSLEHPDITMARMIKQSERLRLNDRTLENKIRCGESTIGYKKNLKNYAPQHKKIHANAERIVLQPTL